MIGIIIATILKNVAAGFDMNRIMRALVNVFDQMLGDTSLPFFLPMDEMPGGETVILGTDNDSAFTGEPYIILFDSKVAEDHVVDEVIRKYQARDFEDIKNDLGLYPELDMNFYMGIIDAAETLKMAVPPVLVSKKAGHMHVPDINVEYADGKPLYISVKSDNPLTYSYDAVYGLFSAWQHMNLYDKYFNDFKTRGTVDEHTYLMQPAIIDAHAFALSITCQDGLYTADKEVKDAVYERKNTILDDVK